MNVKPITLVIVDLFSFSKVCISFDKLNSNYDVDITFTLFTFIELV
jgi:hypothetical protein